MLKRINQKNCIIKSHKTTQKVKVVNMGTGTTIGLWIRRCKRTMACNISSNLSVKNDIKSCNYYRCGVYLVNLLCKCDTILSPRCGHGTASCQEWSPCGRPQLTHNTSQVRVNKKQIFLQKFCTFYVGIWWLIKKC